MPQALVCGSISAKSEGKTELMMVSLEGVARAGEFLAASIIEARGSRASHVAIYGTDLWVETPSGRILRVQVKTASRPSPARWGSLTSDYRFMKTASGKGHSQPDLYFLVALDLQLMLVFDKMATGGTRISADAFSIDAQEYGIATHLF